MNFRRELAEAVMDGRKVVTRRLVSDNPRSPYHPDRAPKLVGKRIAICPGRGKHRIGEATVVGVDWQDFWPALIGNDEARREGFEDASAFRIVWAQLHGSYDPIRVWRIELADPVPADTPEGE